MNPPITEQDLRRLSELEPAPTTVTGRIETRVRRRRIRNRLVLTSFLVILVALGGLALWRVEPDRDTSTADLPAVDRSTQAPNAQDETPALPASSCGDPQPTLAIYLQVTASFSQVEAVADRLSRIRAVERYEYFDQDHAYQELAELFVDSPELVASVRPEDLSPSYRVVLVDTDPHVVAGQFEEMAGVKLVLVRPCDPQSTER